MMTTIFDDWLMVPFFFQYLYSKFHLSAGVTIYLHINNYIWICWSRIMYRFALIKRSRIHFKVNLAQKTGFRGKILRNKKLFLDCSISRFSIIHFFHEADRQKNDTEVFRIWNKDSRLFIKIFFTGKDEFCHHQISFFILKNWYYSILTISNTVILILKLWWKLIDYKN